MVTPARWQSSGDSPAPAHRTAYKRHVETKPPVSRSWDVAPLILMGVALGLLGSRWETVAGALLSLAGLVLLLSGLGRWTWRTRRRTTTRSATPLRVTSSA